MTIALLDADIIAYRAAVATQEEDPFGQPGDLVADPQESFKIANNLVKTWTIGAKARQPLLVFSGSEVFRYSILPTYKRNRSGEKPIIYSEVVAHLEANFKTVRKPRLEADDTIGIMASGNPSRYVAVSIDKDFASIPGWVFNPEKDAIPRLIKPQMADRAWLFQTLTGDTVDGYKGCPRVGPVGATKILDAAGWKTSAMWEAVLQAFLAKGLTLEDAVQQARVARILRHTDFDTDTREIILWHPTTPTRLPTGAPVPSTKTATASPTSTACPSTPASPQSSTGGSKSDRSRKGRKSASRKPASTAQRKAS